MAERTAPTMQLETVKLQAVTADFSRFKITGRAGSGTQFLNAGQVPKKYREELRAARHGRLYLEASVGRTSGRWILRGVAADQEQGW